MSSSSSSSCSSLADGQGSCAWPAAAGRGPSSEASLGPGSALSASLASLASNLVDGLVVGRRRQSSTSSSSTFLLLAASLAAASALLGVLAFYVISATHELGAPKARREKRKNGNCCPGGVCALPTAVLDAPPTLRHPSAPAPAASVAPRRPPPPTLETPLDGIGGGGGRRVSAESLFGGGGGGARATAAAAATNDDDVPSSSSPRATAAAAAGALAMPPRRTTTGNNAVGEGGSEEAEGGGTGTTATTKKKATTNDAAGDDGGENDKTSSSSRAPVSAPVPDGDHRVRWPSDGSEYSGEWLSGRAHGRGTYSWPSGARYEGEWKQGLEEGVGTLLQPDGAAYCGFWRRGQLDGDGVYRPCGGGGGGGGDAAATAAAEGATAAATSTSTDAAPPPPLLPPPRADVIFLRRYSRGVLLSETVLRVADYDAARAARGDARARAAARRAAARERAAAARAARPGETIYKGHASYDLMRSLQMGVLFSTARVGEEALRGAGGGVGGEAATTSLTTTPPLTPLASSSSPSAATAAATAAAHAAAMRRLAPARALTRADFEEQVEQAFPGFLPSSAAAGAAAAAGASHLPTTRTTTASVQSRHGNSPPPFKWKDYAPRAFDALRRAFGVDDGDYLVSLTGERSLRELPSPGKSGSVFFLSDDDRFLIKTVSREEMHSLLRMLPEYVAHVTRPAAAAGNATGTTSGGGGDAFDARKQRPCSPLPSLAAAAAAAPSLLTRFYGVHRVTPSGGAKVRFVVMGNVFPSDVVLHRRYDLKGSRHGRTAGAEALAKPNAVLKDLDVDLALALDARTHAELARALRDDTAFLERQGLIDYSLLLGVHFGGWAPGCWRPPGAPRGSEAPLPPVVVGAGSGAGAKAEAAKKDDERPEAEATAAATTAAPRPSASPRHSHVVGASEGGPEGRRGARATGLALDELIDRLSMSPAASSNTANDNNASAPSSSPSLRIKLPKTNGAAVPSSSSPEDIVLLSPLAAGPSTAAAGTTAAAAARRSRLVSGLGPSMATAVAENSSPAAVPSAAPATTSTGAAFAAAAFGGSSLAPRLGMATRAQALPRAHAGLFGGRGNRTTTSSAGSLFSFTGGGGGSSTPGGVSSLFGSRPTSAALSPSTSPDLLPPPTPASAVAAPEALLRGDDDDGSDGGEPVLLFFGVIDFLQSYTPRKAAEHAIKAVAFASGDSMSVVNPHSYARRFTDAMSRLFVVADDELAAATAAAAANGG